MEQPLGRKTGALTLIGGLLLVGLSAAWVKFQADSADEVISVPYAILLGWVVAGFGLAMLVVGGSRSLAARVLAVLLGVALGLGGSVATFAYVLPGPSGPPPKPPEVLALENEMNRELYEGIEFAKAVAEAKPIRMCEGFDRFSLGEMTGVGELHLKNQAGKTIRVVLLGIDCPADAAGPVGELVGNQQVLTQSDGDGPCRKDDQGRLLRYLELLDGRDLGRLLIQEGICKHRPEPAHPRAADYAALRSQPPADRARPTAP